MTLSAPAKKKDSGLYAVIVSLDRPARIKVGALGMIRFERGKYLYIGSARRALSRRIARHRKRTKPVRWHFDYLRRKARWAGSAPFAGQTGECSLVSRVKRAVNGSVACRGFGSSDCRCPGHLIFTTMRVEEITTRLETLSRMNLK